MNKIKIREILLFTSLLTPLSMPLVAGKRSIDEARSTDDYNPDESELVIDEDYDPENPEVEGPELKRVKLGDSTDSPMQEPTVIQAPPAVADEQAPLSDTRRKGLEFIAFISQEIERGTLFWWQGNPHMEPILMRPLENQPGIPMCPAFDTAANQFVIVNAPRGVWYFRKVFLSDVTLSNTYVEANQEFPQVRLFLADGRVFVRASNTDFVTDMANLLAQIVIEKAHLPSPPPPPPPPPPSSPEHTEGGNNSLADEFFKEVEAGLENGSLYWQLSVFKNGPKKNILLKKAGVGGAFGPLWYPEAKRFTAALLGGRHSSRFMYTQEMFDRREIYVHMYDRRQAIAATHELDTCVYEIFPENIRDEKSLNEALYQVKKPSTRRVRNRGVGSKTASKDTSSSAASSSASASRPAPVPTHVALYESLDVDPKASAEEIRKAYRRLSLQLHPDKNPAEEAKAQLDTVKEAYEVLNDEELRGYYDRYGMPGVTRIRDNKRFATWMQRSAET